MHKLPLDDKDGLIITLSVMRKGTGHIMQHFLEGKHITSEGQLKNIAKLAAELLWDSKDIPAI